MQLRIKSALLTILLGFLSSLPNFAATNGVVVGSDVQAAIDAAAPGDTLLFAPGDYTNQLVFNKPLRVAPNPGAVGDIRFLGSITVQNSGTNSFQRALFTAPLESIGAHLTIIDSVHNNSVLAQGGTLVMKRVTMNTQAPLTLTNGVRFEGLRVSSTARVNSYGSTAKPGQFLAVQCEFKFEVRLNTNKVWLGYNRMISQCMTYLVGCDSVLIGNRFTTQVGNYALLATTGGTLKMYNNLVANGPDGGQYGMYISGPVVTELVNNTIYVDAPALMLENVNVPLNLQANIFRSKVAESLNIGSNPTVTGTFISTSYCLFQGNNDPRVGVTKPFLSCLINVDPLVSTDYLSLKEGSPCIHAGMTGEIYNDRLGGQNTIGYTGGPYYNPANFTNSNPMTFLLLGPSVIFKGSQTTIPITAAASAGH